MVFIILYILQPSLKKTLDTHCNNCFIRYFYMVQFDCPVRSGGDSASEAR